jgi:hypothetical protein
MSSIALKGGTNRLWFERTEFHKAQGTIGFLPPGKFIEEVPRRYYLMITPHVSGDYYATGFGKIVLKQDYYQSVPPNSQQGLYLHGTAAGALAAHKPPPASFAVVGFDAWGAYTIETNGTYLFSNFVPSYVHKRVTSQYSSREAQMHHQHAVSSWRNGSFVAHRQIQEATAKHASKSMQRQACIIERKQAAEAASDEAVHAERARKAWGRFHREENAYVYTTPSDLAAPAPAPSVWYDPMQSGEGNPFRATDGKLIPQ